MKGKDASSVKGILTFWQTRMLDEVVTFSVDMYLVQVLPLIEILCDFSESLQVNSGTVLRNNRFLSSHFTSLYIMILSHLILNNLCI